MKDDCYLSSELTSFTLHLSYISYLLSLINNGEGGIRTHGTLTSTTVFETARFNHSRTSPSF